MSDNVRFRDPPRHNVFRCLPLRRICTVGILVLKSGGIRVALCLRVGWTLYTTHKLCYFSGYCRRSCISNWILLDYTHSTLAVSRVAVRISYNFESRSFSVSVQAQQTKRNISRKILRKMSIPNMLMLWLTNTYYTHLLPQREYFVKIYTVWTIGRTRKLYAMYGYIKKQTNTY